MKKVLFLLFFLVTGIVASNAQSTRYYNCQAYWTNLGYTIGLEQEANIIQGGTAYCNVTFQYGYDYEVIGLSDDADVTDLDLAIYYLDGTLWTQDNDNSNIALINVVPSRTITMKVVIKNYSSRTPNYASKCYFFIAYK